MVVKAVALTDKSDQFLFSVQAESGEVIENQSFSILIHFDKPVLLHPKYTLALIRNHALLVNLGSFSPITIYHLNIVDFKNSGVAFRYMLKLLPKNGTLKLRGEEIAKDATFSQSDISNNLLTYHHDVSKKGEWDFFIFAVVDGNGLTIASDAFPIRMVTDNSAPSFINLHPVPVLLGKPAEITNDMLYVIDQEQGAESLTYQLLALPKKGCIESVMHGILKEGARFTQKDVDGGDIFYKSFGVDLGTDSISFIVDDGVGGVTERTELEIQVFEGEENIPQKLLYGKQGNGKEGESKESTFAPGEKVFPVNKRSRVNLSLANFLACTGMHEQGKTCSFIVTELPTKGRLYRAILSQDRREAVGRGKQVKENEPITTKEFESGLISYQHTSANCGEDQFVFNVQDNRGRMLRQRTFRINITEDNNAPVVVENHNLVIRRGAYKRISGHLLRATDIEQSAEELTYTVRTLPSTGSLIINKTALLKGATFTQDDIDKGLLQYRHNGSQLFEDSMSFSLSDGAGGAIEKIPFNVIITNKPFALLNNNPLSVSAGEGTQISDSYLKVVFTGEESPKLTYTLKECPKKGELVRKGTQLQVGEQFTQAELSGGEIEYRHKS